jgi:hypothetical protein
MASRLRFALLCVSLTWLLGCSGRSTLWLLDVSSLETSTAETGSSLEFSGHGFPTGRSGELVLRGELRTAGESAKRVSLTLRAVALSSTRAAAFVDEQATKTVGAHATFEGNALLRFGRDAKGPWIAGEAHDVTLEWASNEDANDARLRRDAQLVVDSLGIEVSEPVTETGTVRVSGVKGGSAAASARVVIGDRIVSANGLHVRSLADLAPPARASSVRLVLRDAVDGSHTVELDLPRSSGLMLGAYRYLLWVCPVLVALLFLGPWTSPVEVLRSGLSRLRREAFAPFRAFSGSRLKPGFVIIAWTVLCAAASSFTAWTGSGLTLLAALAAYLMLLVFRAWRLEPASTDATDPIERRAHLLTYKLWFLGDGALACLVLAMSSMFGGSSSLAMLASEQGAVPWGWSMFARPTTWLAAWILLSRSGRLHPNGAGEGIEVALDNLGRIVLAVAITAVWFGGATGALGLGPAFELGLSSATFAVKLLGVLCLLAFAQPWAATKSAHLKRVCLALLGLTIVWSWAAPDRTFELRVGSAVLSSLLVAGLVATN